MAAKNRRALAGNRKVLLVNSIIVVLAALLTASLALVVEDALPKPGDTALVVPSRAGLVGIVLVLQVLALWWRLRVHRTTGTLFYVQLLGQNMQDRRAGAVASAGTRHMATRTLIRWADLQPHDRATVTDLSAHCRELGLALESAVNSDRDDTAYAVAPNLLWPAALAVGAYLPGPAGMRLLELPIDDHTPEIELALDDAARHLHVHDPVQLTAPTGRRIGVWLAFTDKAATFSVDRFAEFGCETVHTLTPDENWPPPWLDESAMTGLPAALADELVRINTGNPGRELVVVAMIPKAVAFALGWHLSRRQCQFFTGTYLMNYIGPRRYEPLRVHDSQPTWWPHPDTPATSLRNLTPHPLVIVTDHDTLELSASETPPQVTETTRPLTALEAGRVTVPVLDATQGKVTGLPEPTPGVLLVVSHPVACALPHRTDLVVPHGEIRDPDGRITGCRGVAHINHAHGAADARDPASRP